MVQPKIPSAIGGGGAEGGEGGVEVRLQRLTAVVTIATSLVTSQRNAPSRGALVLIRLKPRRHRHLRFVLLKRRQRKIIPPRQRLSSVELTCCMLWQRMRLSLV